MVITVIIEIKEHFYELGGDHTILILACNLGYSDLLKFLMENGADVNIEDKDERTPLSIGIITLII